MAHGKTIYLCLIIVLALLISLVPAQENAVGSWHGILDVGSMELRLVFHISQSENGDYTATMDSPDQGASGIPASRVDISEGDIKLSFASIGGMLQGKLTKDGQKVEATWSQGGRSFPIVLKTEDIQVEERIDIQNYSQVQIDRIKGFWLGTLKISALELRIVFNIKESANNSLKATMDSPDQGAKGIPVTKLVFEADKVELHAGGVGGKFIGELSGDNLKGTWHQAGQSWPLMLQRTENSPESRRPQTPKPPFPYSESEVGFYNEQADIKLSGAVIIPEGDGPFPAAIFISGSGAQDRDETIFNHKPFFVIADHLARHGIASLRYDDRGTAKSEGNFIEATSQDFATDAAAAFKYLQSVKEIDSEKIGFIGHSEGGLIAPLIAAEDKDVAFLILIAAPGLPGEQILIKQSELISKASGISDETIEYSMSFSDKFYDVIKNELDDQKASAQLTDLSNKYWAGMSAFQKDEMAKIGVNEDHYLASIKQLLMPWFRFFVKYDPRSSLRNVRCPVLAINGSNDLQVDASENLPAIEQALREGGNNNITLLELDGLNHLLQKSATGLPAEYGKIEETVNQEALDTISDWLQKVL